MAHRAFTRDIGAPWSADLFRKKANGEMEDVRRRAAEVNIFNIIPRDVPEHATIAS